MDWYRWRHLLGRDQARNWRRANEETPPRPRVLFESPDGAEAHAVWSLLDRHGYDTMWCAGPSGRPSRECSLVRVGNCPLVDRADIIVNTLDQGDWKCAEVARHLDRSADVVPGPLRSRVLLHQVAQATSPQTAEATTGR